MKELKVITTDDEPLGYGNSQRAIRRALSINEKFNIKNGVVFTTKDFIKKIKSSKNNEVIVFDEVRV